MAGLAVLCWAADPAPPDRKDGQQDSREAAKPKPQRWYSDCPGCATTLGKGGRAGPFSTVEECREKVARLVANGYPYGFCRLEQ
jgi:hypothetical protein